jgi:hypothetical protein
MTKNQNGNIHRTETPDVSHIRNIEVTHERSDVDVSAIVKFVLLLTVMTVGTYILMWGLFRLYYAQTQNEPQPGPMAMSEAERLPPEPRLQGARGFGDELAKTAAEKAPGDPRDPEWEIRVLKKLWDDNLQHGLRGPNGEIVGLPIEEAMKKVVESGLPSRSNGSLKVPDLSFQDFAISIPTAASSGRMTEKRLQ